MEITSDNNDNTDIAIIGMSCRFPGHCNDLGSFWELLASGGDGITTTDCRWGDDVAMPTSKYGGFIDDVDCFDAAFFSILPKEAIKMDPQHRVLLELHWEALESACIPWEDVKGCNVGVYTGIAWNDYERLCHSTMTIKNNNNRMHPSEHHDLYLTTGTAHAMAAGLVSFFFDFRGPAMAIDTASSSSLISTHLACQALLGHECNMAFASGVCLNLSPEIATNFTQSKMLSDRSRVFDVSAGGYCRSEGAAMVMLKRYHDAVYDGNRILGVIKGTAVNNNGRGPSGITAPNPQAQEDIYRRTLRNAGLQPADIQYIEAHGTGTPVGDPAELESLVKIYGKKTGDSHPPSSCKIGIGSLKTNIGHTEMAAGLAGVIKIVLALEHEFIPPHIHFNEQTLKAPNLAEYGLEILAKGKVWPRDSGSARMAAVSSFGLFGTNAHAIISDAPPSPPQLAPKVESTEPQLRPPAFGVLTVSAKIKDSLDVLQEKYQQFLGKKKMEADHWLNAAYTSNVGRTHFSQHRSAFLLGPEFPESLTLLSECKQFHGTCSRTNPTKSVHFILTGAYSEERRSLGAVLYKTHAHFRELLYACVKYTSLPLVDFVLEGEVDQQHGILIAFTLQYCIAATLIAYGVVPSKCTCYGYGEYVGACLAGIVSLEDTLKLVLALEAAAATESASGDHDIVKHFDVILVQQDSISMVKTMLRTQQQQWPDIHIYDTPHASKDTAILIFGESTQLQQLATCIQSKLLPEMHFCMPTSKAKEFIRISETIQYHRQPITGSKAAAAPAAAATGPAMELAFGYGKSGTQIDASFWLESRFPRATHGKMSSVRFSDSVHTKSDSVVGEPIMVFIGAQQEMVTAWKGRSGSGSNDQQFMAVSNERSVYELLAKLYSIGHCIQWSTVHKGQHGARKLIELPKYAFDKRRYWYPSTPLRRGKVRNECESTKTPDKPRLMSSVITFPEDRVDLICKETPQEWNPDVQRYMDQFQELCITRIVRAFALLNIHKHVAAFGVAGAELNVIAAAAGIVSKHGPLFEHLVSILSGASLLATDSGAVRIGPIPWPTVLESSARAESMHVQLRQLDSTRNVLLELSLKCGHDLHLILQGKKNALVHLFPPPSQKEYNVERFYATDPDLQACNRALERVIGALSYCNENSSSSSDHIRILEVGAGTGGTTSHLLTALISLGLKFELEFTDISRAFFHDAKLKLQTGANVVYRLLDIEQDPLKQGYEAQSFDLVLASNVVHATKNTRQTLENMKAVLRPGGYILLCEYVHQIMALDTVFGNLPGWWAFKGHDPDRSSHAIMSPKTWIGILEATGFEPCRCIGFPTAVIIGRLKPDIATGFGVSGAPNEAVVITAPVTTNAGKESIRRTDSVQRNLGVLNSNRASYTEVKAKIIDILVNVTGLEPDDIDNEREFQEFGMDSIRMRTFGDMIGKEFNHAAGSAGLPLHNNIQKLAQHISGTKG